MDWTAIIIALAAAIPGTLAYLNQRRDSQANAVEKLTGSALEIVQASRDETARLRTEFDEYRAESEHKLAELREELRLQEIQIDNNNSFTLKLQLVITILSYQLRERGITPYVEPSEMESITINELRRRAATLSNLVNRQETGKDTLILK